VRPLFLSVFEDHILKLDGVSLRPALKAIILSLLPGLEDETSEDFERMVSALDKLRRAVQDQTNDMADSKSSNGHASHFWQCFFLASITNASRRQGALAFLTRRLPKFGLLAPKNGTQSGNLTLEAEAAVHPEPGLLIRCFESGLSDPQLLIQRGFLDLIVSHLPLNSPVLQQRISKTDLERLVAAAAGVVSRRDMSLNRRLWAWFLGPEPSTAESAESPTQERHDTSTDPSTVHAAYFSRYGLAALTTSVLKMIRRHVRTPAERARPFRVCLSLMDRWEVGGLIVPELFLPALQSVQTYSEHATKEQVDEVMRSASAFFDGVDSGLIWGKLTQLVTSSLDGSRSKQEALQQMKLAKFVLARFNLKEEDMLLHHMPLMIIATLSSLGQISQDRSSEAIDGEVIDLALEIADSLVQIVPDRALKAEPASNAQHSTTELGASKTEVLQQIATFYDDAQAGLESADRLYEPGAVGRAALRQASHMTLAALQTDGWSQSPELPSKILANLVVKTQDLDAVDDFDFSSVLQKSLSRSDPATSVPFSHLRAAAGILVALQVARPLQPYVSASRLSELLHLLVASLWHYLSPTMPKYHVEATLCMLQLHSISPSGRLVEAAISSIIAAQIQQRSSAAPISDCGRRFAVLWTHTMHELNLQSEKRGSVTRRPSGMFLPTPPLSPATYHSVLTRPLLLLMDTLNEEGTENATFMKSWLLDLPTLSKVFEVLAVHLQSLQCLEAVENLGPQDNSKQDRMTRSDDDTRECLYYLGQVFYILKRPSQFTWSTLARTAATWAKISPDQMSLQEWLIRKCLGALSIQAGVADAVLEPHIHELHRIAISIISQIYQSPFAPTLRDLEVEVPLMVRLRTAVPSLQSLLLGAILSALRIRLIQSPQEKSQELRPPQNVAQRSRLSLALNRDSVDHALQPIPPPPQLVECLKFGFSSPLSRLVLDDWVQFLIEVLPMFADIIFQNLLPLVECLCKEINDNFDLLKITFARHEALVGTSPETTLISLINGLEQILAKAHDRLMVQETQVSANKSPEAPQGFFSNVVSGVFAAEANQTRTPTANSRLTVLLCFQDTVRICFAIWSWGGFAQDRQDPTSVASFSYTSLRMRNRARRLLEHLFAAEALECLETLVVSWAQTPQEDAHETAVMGLLNVLNGSRPKLTIPAIFNAVYSRTDPNALDTNRMSTLTSNLSDTDLVTFLVEYTRSLEDDAMDEIWQDCTLFLRDVLANPLPHRQILPSLLEFTAVIGQKVDNTTFGEQRKMRRELAVSCAMKHR
jgi:hypothetical protein